MFCFIGKGASKNFSFYYCFALLLLYLPSSLQTCPSCPTECTCTLRRLPQSQGIMVDSCEVNCTDVNFNRFPDVGTPNFISWVYMDNNSFTSFSLSIERKRILEISFSNNLIKILTAASFSGYTRLEILDLSHNQIESIPSDCFDQTPALEEVNLSGNLLKVLPDDLLSLPTLTALWLSANSWVCNCELKSLQNWMLANSDKIPDISQTICANPLSVKGQNLTSVNLTIARCADSFISCAWDFDSSQTDFIVWEYTDMNETKIYDDDMCIAFCFSHGYYFAVVNLLDSSCLCASKDTAKKIVNSNSSEWSACFQACGQTKPAEACGRKGLYNSVFRASPELTFVGLRPFSQREEVVLTVVPKIDIVNTYMWNFNDSSSVVITEHKTVRHKFAYPGYYWVSVTAQTGAGSTTYSLFVIVEEPVSEVFLTCDNEVSPAKLPSINITMDHGTNAFISWSLMSNGTKVNDWKFCPAGSTNYSAKKICYKSYDLEKSWSDARDSCLREGGDLVVIDSADVELFLSANVLQYRAYWIGISDTYYTPTNKYVKLRNNFIHVNGRSVYREYENWDTNEPDTMLTTEAPKECVALNVSGKWSTAKCDDRHSYICQYSSQDELLSPKHQLAGTVVFESTYPTVKNVTATSPALNLKPKHVILFPGMWTFDEGFINSWEVVAKAASSAAVEIRFQIYRPKCSTAQHLQMPGCSSSMPYATCATSTCLPSIKQCPAGQQFCCLTNECQSPYTSCNYYNDESSSRPARHSSNIPNYHLVAEYPIQISGTAEQLYQLSVTDELHVESGDVIGVMFTSELASTTFIPTLANIPIVCKNSSLSSWSQSAMFFSSTKSQIEILNSSLTYDWLDYLWCDVRLHYTKPLTPLTASSTFLIQETPGEYTFTAMVNNQVSLIGNPGENSSCTVTVLNEIREVKLLSSLTTKTESGELVVFVARGENVTFTFQVVGGGENTVANWTTSNTDKGISVAENQTLESGCPTGVELNTTDCTRLFTSVLKFDEIGNSSVVVTAANTISRSRIEVKVVTQEVITGAQILPTGVNRILAQIPLEFTSSYTTGSDVTTEWVVDGLVDNKVVKSTFPVLFRKTGNYNLMMILSNEVSTQNVSTTFQIDLMNKLTNEKLLNSPTNVELNQATIFNISFSVDKNIDVNVTWTIDGVEEAIHKYLQPHSGSIPQTNMIELEDSLNKTFAIVGQVQIRVTISNEYDSVELTHSFHVKAKIISLELSLANQPAVNEEIELITSIQPSPYESNREFDWGDGTSPSAAPKHTYTAPGEYNVTVKAENGISSMKAWKVITVYERITQLTAWSDEPTEFTQTTTVSASVVTGNGTTLFLSYDFGDNSPVVENQTQWNYIHTYSSTGIFFVTITATNPISSLNTTLEVNVFQLEIVSVNTSTCFKMDDLSILHVVMPTSSYDLFTFEWDFGDGSSSVNVSKNNTATHIYSIANSYSGSVTVNSIRTSNHDTEMFTVCVQEEVKGVLINKVNQAVATGSAHEFTFTVIGGTDATYVLYFGDGNHTTLSTLSASVSHTYNQAGDYFVILNAQNLVSNMNGTITAIVQDPISGLDFTTSSEYGFKIALGHTVTYTATSSGSNVTYTWTFGDGSAPKTGNPVQHIYNGTIDNFRMTVTAANLIDSKFKETNIAVYHPVFGFEIQPLPSIVVVGTTINFNLTSNQVYYFYWKITPSLTSIHEWDGTGKSISQEFLQSGEYTVVLKAENIVSSENRSAQFLVADPISSISIASDDPSSFYSTSPSNYIAENEVTFFQALLDNGASVLTTVYGQAQFVFYEWRITMQSNATFLEEFTDVSKINYTFRNNALYYVWLNVSNTVTTQTKQITLNVIQRITGVRITKEGSGPPDSIVTGTELKLRGSVSSGSSVSYTWRAFDGDNPKDYHNNEFEHTYTIPGMYKVLVDVENPLDQIPVSFTLYVEDEITGLQVEHINPIVPFYVAYGTDTLFKANVSTGTGVLYYWQYTDTVTGVKSDCRIIERNLLYWNFTGGNDTVYTLSVNASNKVSWDQKDTTVYVISPVLDLLVNITVDNQQRNIVSTNLGLMVDATVSSGSEVHFLYNFGDSVSSVEGVRLTSTSSQASHVYAYSGVYEVQVIASNNATSLQHAQVVYVRDPISGLDIDGLTQNQYLRNDQDYTFSAIITSGTNVTFSWKIINSDASSVDRTGDTLTFRFSVVGNTEIQLNADNVVNITSKSIFVMIRQPPTASITLLTQGDIFTDQNFLIEVATTGTNVLHDIDFKDGVTEMQSNKTIHTHQYATSGTYNITVRAYNRAADVIKSMIIFVGKLACGKPTLSIAADGEPVFYRSRMLYLETRITTDGCTAYDVQYVWTIHQQLTCHDLTDSTKVNSESLDADTPLLTLPALTLEVGDYCVTCSVSYKNTPLTDSQVIKIRMLPTPLVVVISGGTYRFMSTNVKLDASSSFDPDYDPNSPDQSVITYQWSCSSKPAKLEDIQCGAAVTNKDDNCFTTMHGPTIEFNNAVPKREYNFTVVANKTGKIKVSSWQSVTIVGCAIPTVKVTCNSCLKQSSIQISSSHHLVLSGLCETCSNRKDDLEYQWEAVRRNATDVTSTPFLLNKLTTTTGSSGRYLVVRVGAIQSYYEYEFKLTIKVNGVEGYSKLILYANKPPVNGVCNINFSGDQIYVLDTLVQFECTGWKDEDISPLIYTILAIRYNEGVKVDDFVIYKGTLSTYEAYLPLGYKTNEYDIVIEIRVEDELGTYTVGISKVLNVKLPVDAKSNTVEWLVNKTSDELLELKKSSNPQVVADFAAGLITVLNQESDNQGHSTVDSEFQLRKEIRQNITETVISLSTNTLDEIKQVTTVFKQCVQVASEMQDNELQVASIEKLEQLTSQMPEYVESASQTLFHSVTTNLMGIVSSMVDSANYHVYVTGEASSGDIEADTSVMSNDPTLSADYRKTLVNRLLDSAVQLNQNILDGKVEGEEPVFINASALSSVSARTTPATMNSTVMNNGCHMSLPHFIFSDLDDDTEILYMFFVAEQNPFTFGFLTTSLSSDSRIANISTRVPSLQFSYHNNDQIEPLEVKNLAGVGDSSMVDSKIPDSQFIRMVMAPSNRQFIPNVDTSEIATLSNSTNYSPRKGVSFVEESLESLKSLKVTITNNNTDPYTAVHIMVVFDKETFSTKIEPNPYIDVYFDFTPSPTAEKYNQHLRLTENLVSSQSDHRNYTIYLNPANATNSLPKYYLNISSYFEHHTVKVGVGVYYSSCQYFDNDTEKWSISGLRTSDQTVPSAAVCLSAHLTAFGSFVISPPNIVDIDITDIDFRLNPIALIVVIVVFVAYLLGAMWARKLDLKDIENASLIPLCGHNGSHKYEITIKTSPGIGSGTTANVGICLYGYESRTGSKHLYKKGSFERGSVDVFQVASDTSLGTLYKIKIWHDNTGIDPGWNLSRVMVKDLQNGEKYYFLVDSWLQVYPNDEDATCLARTIRVATEEEMEDFSYLFGNQMSYGWEDAHLWLSLIERPQRSRFTLVQRLTCCVTLLYSFMLASAFWFQNFDGDSGLVEDVLLRWSDIAVGAVVSLMIFPVNIILVTLFKHTKSKVSAIKPWPDRTQTAQTVEILDEILDGRSKGGTSGKIETFDGQSRFGSIVTLPGQSEDGITDSQTDLGSRKTGGLHKTSGTLKSLDIKDKFWLAGGDETDDTGFGSKGSSPTQLITDMDTSSVDLKHGTTTNLPLYNADASDSEDDFWDPFLNEQFEEYSETGTTRTNLRRTRKAKFNPEDDLELEDVEDDVDPKEEDYDSDDVPLPDMRNTHSRRVYLRSRASTTLGLNSENENQFLLPHWTIYFTYFLCFSIWVVSIFFIILYVHEFGVTVAQRWLFTMFIALLESFFLIEPTKVLILAAYIAMFTRKHAPEENDNLVEDPLVETYEHVKDNNKVRPPRGFALEHCKLNAKKSYRSRKLLVMLMLHGLFLWAVMAFCVWDRDNSSYLSSWSIKKALYEKPMTKYGVQDNQTMTFDNIRTVSEVWGWMEQVMSPLLFEDTLDNSINQNHLLGNVRIRQQRSIPRTCTIAGNNELNPLLPNQNCLPPNQWKLDEKTYYPGWTNSPTLQNATWVFEVPCFTGIGYWGQEQIYDDSGYSKYIDGSLYKNQLQSMQEDSWIDRYTRVCMVEFTMLNPASQWFTVTTVMFEIGSTGAVRPSHITQTIRLFTPSSYFTLDMLFISFIGVLGFMFWVYEIVKILHHKQNISVYAKKPTNWMNNLVNLLTLLLCCMFVYKQIYIVMFLHQLYKWHLLDFTNFYKMAFLSNLVTYVATILLTILLIKLTRLIRFIKRWSVFGDTIYCACKHVLGTAIMLLVLMVGYALFGYLIFGLNSIAVVKDFRNFQNSLYSMFRALRGTLDTQLCFHVNPAFSICFFFSFYFCVFVIFCRLFSAIYIQEYKDAKFKLRRVPLNIPDYEMIPYMFQRLKLRLGITKPKQYRPTVRFEGMSTPSSRGSFLSTDSFGTCFTAGRLSECSDGSGISLASSDSGLGTPSGHSLSLFDYLTLEHPPYEKPMDSIHLDYLYNRLSSYSVDMMLVRFQRLNKISDDVWNIEKTLLEITQKDAHRNLLRQKSSEIAAAASTPGSVLSQTTTAGSSRSSTSNRGRESNSRSLYSSLSSNSSTVDRALAEETRFSTVVNSMFPTTSEPSSVQRRRSVRSSSYAETTLSATNKRNTISSASAAYRLGETNKPTLKRRPHSDEGARIQLAKSKKDNAKNALKITKKSAW
ncbi:LOW QUALITY PROTEIN: polycystin-1 [Ciona intestinalis]